MNCPNCNKETKWSNGTYYCKDCDKTYKKEYFCDKCNEKMEVLDACGARSFFCQTCNELKSSKTVKMEIKEI